MKRRIVFRNQKALGDTICLSALPRDLAAAYPGRFEILHVGHYLAFWEANPWSVVGTPQNLNQPGTEVFELSYKAGIGESRAGRRIHFLAWIYEAFSKQFGVKVPVLQPKGDIWIRPSCDRRRVEGRYWLVVAGGKKDMTAKTWETKRFQEVVDRCRRWGIRFVQAGALHHDHYQPKLSGVVDLVDQTPDVHDLHALVKYSEGVLCGVTSFMHAAAAFDKPCVVVAGGREEPWWEGYTDHGQWGPACEKVPVPHRYLHTLGLLDCCRSNGCWKKRTVPIERRDHLDPAFADRLCLHPVKPGDQHIPRCLDLITPDHVCEAILSYYEDRTLPPLR